MAWQEPFTSWAETDRCTYADMNRIAGNVNEICGTSLKEDYTQNDVVTLTEWEAILSALDTLAATYEYIPEDEPDTSVTASNFNAVESFTLGLKEWIDLINAQAAARSYVGDPIYSNDNQYLR